MQDRENRQTVSLERQDSGPTFEDGIWFAIQLLVADREFDEPVLAEGIASAAGLTAPQMRSLQRKSGYKNARMYRFIKEYEEKKESEMSYRITASCDPYHVRRHYNGQKILRYDMATPVKWVIEDDIPTLEEAKEKLMRLAKTGDPYGNGGWTYEDQESVEEYRKEMLELHGDEMTDEEKETLTDWFAGPGIYENQSPVLLEGGTSFHDDTMTYMIEAIEQS